MKIKYSFFSRNLLILFAVVFSAIGLFAVWHSFAIVPNVSYGDLNNDTKVDVTDLSILISNYNTSNVVADINGDGSVNIIDLSILLSHYNTPVPSGVQPVGIQGSWTIKFDDEFNGTSLDLSKWSNCWFSPTCGSMNNVTTSPSNVAVSGGNLVLTLSSTSTGALVSTNPHGGANPGFDFQYGVAEARIYFPGNGTDCYNWPAWWTDGQNWPNDGENDIAEVLSSGDMTVNYHSISGAHNQGAVPGYWCDGFHTYSIYRQAAKADVYYDGVKVKSYATDDNGAMHYLIINVGNNGTINTGTSSQVKVDYVRFWQ
jgi:hypothetical protein